MDRRIKFKPRTTAVGVIWSLLLSEIVINIGNCLLATGDVDYYTAMRAVCHNWRAAMDDPKRKQTDPRFLLRQWVMLDEELPRGTGRFLHKELPELADYYLVISTGCFLVLATRSSPHTVCIINPLTASGIKFKAHMPDDEHFSEVKYNLVDKTHNIWGITDSIVDGLLRSIIATRSWEKYPRFYFLQSAGEMLLVLGRKHPGRGMEVFKVNSQQKVIEPTKSIGSRALFLGIDRCVSVDAHKIPSINGNCIFYLGRCEHNGQPGGIYMYNLTSEKEEKITSDLIQFIGLYGKPVTPSIIQLLTNYCTNIPWSQLENERHYGFLEEEEHKD